MHYFNPCSRGGSNETAADMDSRSSVISIHASAKGATLVQCLVCNPAVISIPAPAKGATASGVLQANGRRISIHAPAEGATLPPCNLHSPHNHFNPHSRKGSDLSAPRLFIESRYYFNSRSRKGSDAVTVGFLLLMMSFQSTLSRRKRQQTYTIFS